MKKYANIVFLQNSEADEPLSILADEGIDFAFTYLLQWDYGEYYDIKDKPGNGTSDRTIIQGDYLLTYNNLLGYIGLEKIINE